MKKLLFASVLALSLPSFARAQYDIQTSLII